MKTYNTIIIGFGKGGKTLAGKLAKSGKTVALIEQSPEMYGGTCINVACIPSKSLEDHARQSHALGGSWEEKESRYLEAINDKRALTAMLRGKNHGKVVSAGVDVIDGKGSFLAPHKVSVLHRDGTSEELSAENICINTGSRPFLPPIPGLKESSYVYTSETLMELEQLPKKMAIIGGGYIGLEFASYYTNFGSEVTIIQDGEAFIPREDSEVAAAVLDSFEKRGIRLVRSATIVSIKDQKDHVNLSYKTKDGEDVLHVDAILVATGRRPNLEGLNPEKAGVELTERGAVKVDAHLRTTAEHVWAMGDVCGGLQFTYISLDDFRIVASDMLSDGKRTNENRGSVPYTVFLDPPLSRVGLSEEEAKQKGLDYVVVKLPAAAIPKAQVLRRPMGLLKAIVDKKSGEILGCHLFCAQSEEMINTVRMAMENHIPASYLRDAIYTHPTMSEAFNDLFQGV